VHSMVEYVDGSVLAQLGIPDMAIPISYILAYPERLSLDHLPSLDLVQAGRLEFHAPDLDHFPCLELAYRALRHRGTAPAVLNAANEVAVGLFLAGRARFYDIPAAVRRALDREGDAPAASLSDLLAADLRAREAVLQFLSAGAPS